MKFAMLRRHFLIGSLGLALSAGFGSPAFAADDLLQQIQQKGTLKVGLEGTYPPFNFQDESGKLTGFEVEFAEALGKQLGVKVEFQPTKWDGILASLESRRLDVVINQVTISEERKKKYDFSTPYTVSGIQVLTRKGREGEFGKPEDLNGKKVGVVLGTNYEQWLKDNVPQADIRTYDDDATRNQDVRVGRLDAILGDRLAAFELISKTGDTLAVAGAPFAPQEAGIALRKGNPQLLAALDEAIAKLRADGTLQAISEKWFQADVTQ
ncbi:cystine ABC transporter substrate-binding protein [Phytopseudomonas dryadis]|uniref:Cystine ABC transporter substrate-binding protein n=1 Tax=Phytopseudomonas dryadis TaxID=2487520 RepID=A0A4Q9R9Z7_9GAMM|nr:MULTISPECIES: cystine ABC transporter substrate-binding protein [Pseudomonas]TBU97550.1 cystine ABC transporter substrate-binding protein [Pseudomonas dryadis]TBV10005.1 cystine ABC transporter substrate-binding protein [Pseudomonas dryadis]TBV19166.1 cystine ABC transporter substrate-binding protein [Pseudomonas sp. FRB 230]